MASAPPADGPTGPKVSSTRRTTSLVLLFIVLVVCVIEMRAGLGQFLTIRSFNDVSDNNMFTNEVSFADVQGMLAGFPSESTVEFLGTEDEHHYHWFSLLRPMMGMPSPELYVTVDHGDPPRAITFYTAIQDHANQAPDHRIDIDFTETSQPVSICPDDDSAAASEPAPASEPVRGDGESDTSEEPE